MRYKIYIINGPNINLLGIRSHEIYGTKSWADIKEILIHKCLDYEIAVDFFFSNSEADIIDKIHTIYMDNDNKDATVGIIINAGAYSHSSYAIADAIEAVNIPSVEVHLSNIYAREKFRHSSVIAPVCMGQITGFKHLSYVLAIDLFKNLWKSKE